MSLTPRIDRLDQNYIINGAMEIAQRGTSFVAIANSAYSLDRFVYFKSGAMVHTVTQDTDVPSFVDADYTFQNSLRLNLTTPDTSLTGTEHTLIGRAIEGYNWAKLSQKAFTVSFWVKATTPGVYTVAAVNGGNDRSCVKEFTINSANTWEKKTLVFPASPISGTWNYVNGVGLRLYLCLGAGPTYQTSPDVWQTGLFFSTSSAVNGLNTGSTDFRFTGLSVLEGEVDSPEFSLFGKTIQEELAACQRYAIVLAQPTGTYPTGTVTTSGTLSDHRFFIPTPVTMRAVPTTSLTGNISMSVNGTAYVLSAFAAAIVHPNGIKGACTTSAGPGANHHASIHLGGQTITMDAEL